MNYAEQIRLYFDGRMERPFPDQDGNETDRSKLLTASTAMSCIRRNWYDKHGTVPDNDFEEKPGYWIRGHRIEEWVIEGLIGAGINVNLTGADQVSFTMENVSGTPDGITDDGVLLEIKSIDPRTGRHNLPRKEHVAQAQINAELASHHGHDVTGIRLIYVDASNWYDIIEYDVPFDDEALSVALFRADKLFGAEDGSDLYPEGADKNECRYCKFVKTCGDATMPSRKHSKADSTEAAQALTKAFTTQTMIKELQVREKAEKNALRQLMTANKITELTSDKATALLVETPGRESLDKGAVKDAGIDLEPFTKTGKPGSRLTITQK